MPGAYDVSDMPGLSFSAGTERLPRALLIENPYQRGGGERTRLPAPEQLR